MWRWTTCIPRNFVEYFEHAGFEQVDYLIGAWSCISRRNPGFASLTKVARNVVTDKFDDGVARPRANVHLRGDPEVESILEVSAKVFAGLTDMLVYTGGHLPWRPLHSPTSLFNGSNYYLIDFLDSFHWVAAARHRKTAPGHSVAMEPVDVRQPVRWAGCA